MRPGEYFRGLHLTVRSPLSADEIERRINEEARSRLNPFATGVVGGVFAGRLRLKYRRFFRSDWKPLLTGRIFSEGRQSRIELVYRGPIWALPFFILWYAIIVLMTVTMIVDFLARSSPPEDAWVAAIILPVFYLVPVLGWYFSTRGAQADCEHLRHFIARVTEAQVETKPRRQGKYLGEARR